MYSAPHRFADHALAELREVQAVDVAQIGEVGVHFRVQLEADVLALEAHGSSRLGGDGPQLVVVQGIVDGASPEADVLDLARAQERNDGAPLGHGAGGDTESACHFGLAAEVFDRGLGAHDARRYSALSYKSSTLNHKPTKLIRGLPEADSAVPDTNETIGARIRRLRTSAGLSQSELATAAGVTKAAISQWETGNVSNLKAVNLIALAHAFEVSAEEVWSGMPAKAGPTALADIPPRRLDLIRAYGRLPDAWRKPIRMMIESLDASIDPKRRAFEADRARASEVIRRSGKARDKAPT